VFGNQYPLPNCPQGPSTSIFLAYDRINFIDFNKYLIEHEKVENAQIRITDTDKSYNSFIRQETIEGYVSQSNKILLLSGKKKFVSDFCKKDFDDLRFDQINVDMEKLRSLIPNVKGVWFRFTSGQISASALMGSDIDETNNFKDFQKCGEISSLTFPFGGDPIMITKDGVVVIYKTYKERTEEIALVMTIKKQYLDKIK
jgi:hypothetical protein